jgi:hypothetical protein
MKDIATSALSQIPGPLLLQDMDAVAVACWGAVVTDLQSVGGCMSGAGDVWLDATDLLYLSMPPTLLLLPGAAVDGQPGHQALH